MSGLYWIGGWILFGWATFNAWFYGPNRTWAWAYRDAETTYGQFQPLLAGPFGIPAGYTIDLAWERMEFGRITIVAAAVVVLTVWVMWRTASRRRREPAIEFGPTPRRRR